MEVILTEKQMNDLRISVFQKIQEGIEQANAGTFLNSKTFMKKFEAVDYLNVSNNTFDGFILEGLPSHTVKGVVRYYKKELDEFMLEH